MPTLSMVDYINFGDFNLDCKWQLDNVIKDSTNCPHIIRQCQIVCHFCQPENYHLLTSRGFGCYLSTSRNITPDFKQKVCDLTLLPWYSRFHVFLFLRCFLFFFCVLMFECLCLSGIECCTPCRARMSLTADNCFALLHSPLHPPPFMMMLHFLYWYY